MRRVALVALTASLLVTIARPLVAQEPAGLSPEGGPGFPAADVPEQQADGIANWWSWDYKKKHLPPPFGFALVNFGIFALIMARLAGKPFRQFVLDRHLRIR